MIERIIKLRDLKKTMKNVRERWKEQCLDINVFFEEVLMNVKISTVEIKKPRKKRK